MAPDPATGTAMCCLVFISITRWVTALLALTQPTRKVTRDGLGDESQRKYAPRKTAASAAQNAATEGYSRTLRAIRPSHRQFSQLSAQ